MLSFLWVIVSLNLVAPIAGEPALRGRSIQQAREFKRAACTTDNVLSALRSAGATASAFCSSYLGIPVKTVYTHVPGVTPVISTQTVPAIASVTPNSAYYPNTLPTYISAYPTPSRISSGCSCLSVKQSSTTSTISSGTSTVYSYTTTTTTTTLTGPCATATTGIYIGTHNISAPNADDSFSDLGTAEADPYTCCSICNSPFEGPFASCLVWAVIAGECKLVIQNGNYMQPNCHAGGKEPATIDVNAKTYPKDVGGLGNCAGAVTVVNA